MRRRLTRIRAAVGLAGTQLRRAPARTALAVFGIALAVLAVTLLASVGYGVLTTGEQKFDASGRDLWVTGGPIQLSPSSSAPVENTVVDAHRVADEIARHDDVAVATPMAFQSVYVGTNESDLRLLTGWGLTGGANGIETERGPGFTSDDVHYANGTYEGPMTREVVVDRRTAALFNLSVGDTIHAGASKESARTHTFTVVGVSEQGSQFLGTPTVAFHLSELQALTGTTAADRATLITIRLRDSADVSAVQATLAERYPQYEVRTNREQLRRVLGNNAVVFVSAGALVVLAVVAGVALTVTLQLLLVRQQRPQLAALRAIGLRGSTLTALVGGKGLLFGLAGGALGLAATPVAVAGLNRLAAAVVGFDSLLQTPVHVYAGGAAIAIGIGTLSALSAGWHLTRLPSVPDQDR